jgi:outer membrane lipoprotein-sorting protein
MMAIHRTRTFRVLCLTLLVSVFSLSSVLAQSVPDIQQYTSAKIKTLHLSTQISYENRAQLDNIGGDFANFFQAQRGAKSLTLIYKQPGQILYYARVLGAKISYIIDGSTRTTEVPLFHIKKSENIAGSPGKQNTLLDCGVVPPEQLDDYTGTYLRTESGLLCFQLMSKIKSEPFKDLVWIDPKTHITVQRYHYDRNGKRVAWYLYKNPKLIAPGIYFPTRVEVYSPENKLAGVTLYQNIQVNIPVAASAFQP